MLLPRYHKLAALAVSFLVSLSILPAQTLVRQDNVPFTKNGNPLAFALAGGINNAQLLEIDINDDGLEDLVVFDPTAAHFIPFVNGGTANTVDYSYAPQYLHSFPPVQIKDWVLAADYDCDGKNDLFVGNSGNISVWRTTSTPGNLSFQLSFQSLSSDFGMGQVPLLNPSISLPVVKDMDGDGDVDLLIFDGNRGLHYHQNQYFDNNGSCGGFDLTLIDACWGKIGLDPFSSNVSLGITCKAAAPSGANSSLSTTTHPIAHLALYEEDGDGDFDLLVGRYIPGRMISARNAGTTTVANMDSVDPNFPNYNTPVEMLGSPAPFVIDVNNDGKKDLLVGYNEDGPRGMTHSLYYYQNIHPSNGATFSLQTKDFLQEQMIDEGALVYPVFFDYDGDGKLDILLGNGGNRDLNDDFIRGISVYRNESTSAGPAFSFVTSNYANLRNILDASVFTMHPCFGDLDGDGDLDMLIGDLGGELHYLENTAPTGQPASFPGVVTDFMGIDVGNAAAPFLADIDRDGKLDLIVGELGGTLNYFRNTGTAQTPAFASMPDDDAWGNVDTDPICCLGNSVPFIFENPVTGRYDMVVGGENGMLPYYRDFESYLGGAFPVFQATLGGISATGNAAIAGADYDNDGVMDWVLGNLRGGITMYRGNSPLTDAVEAVTPELGLEVYPNPSAGELNIRFAKEKPGAISISILDMTGRTLYTAEEKGVEGSFAIDAAEWAAGIYFVEATAAGNATVVKKWVLTH